MTAESQSLLSGTELKTQAAKETPITDERVIGATYEDFDAWYREDLIDELIRLNAALSRLRSTSLTPEEAQQTIAALQTFSGTSWANAIMAKLQSISGRSTESGVPK